ncbi:MAG: hypothetical protein LBB23_00005, partial [Rickettsiales bacterium]|nr:hypothetical protein [Rickettsiales bacterium]
TPSSGENATTEYIDILLGAFSPLIGVIDRRDEKCRQDFLTFRLHFCKSYYNMATGDSAGRDSDETIEQTAQDLYATKSPSLAKGWTAKPDGVVVEGKSEL